MAVPKVMAVYPGRPPGPGRSAPAGPRPVYASSAEVLATPLVHKLAARYGVDLREITGTGVGDRITTRDVQAHPTAAVQVEAARLLDMTGSPAFAAADHTAGRREIAIRSAFSTDQVTYDPYGPSPLVEDARQHNPEAYAAALGIGPAPALFAAGDLPAFTASGLDPRELRKLPWQVRLAAAADPDKGRVYAMFEEYADDPEAAAFDLGLSEAAQDYQADVQGWLARGAEALRVASWQVPVQRPTRL